MILAGQGVYSPYINFNEYFNGLDWVEFIPLPINVRYHSAVTWRKHIWVFGGFYYRNILSNDHGTNSEQKKVLVNLLGR